MSNIEKNQRHLRSVVVSSENEVLGMGGDKINNVKILVKNKFYGYRDMVTMSMKTSWMYSIIFAIKYTIDALIPTFSIFIIADFINSAKEIYTNQGSVSLIFTPVVLLTVIMIYNSTKETIMRFIDSKRNIFFRKRLVTEMLEKNAKLEYRYVEDPVTADLIERVCPEFSNHVWSMYLSVLNAASLTVYLFGIGVALFTQVWWVATAMFISAIPIVRISMKAGRHNYDAGRELSKVERRLSYLSDVMLSREAFEERSIFGYVEELNNQYIEKYEYVRKFKLKVEAKNFIHSKMGGLVTSVFSIVVMFAMLVPVSNGDIDIGMFIALMNAVFGLSTKLSYGINWIIVDLTQKREYLKDLTRFMQLNETDGATDLPKKNMKFQTIEFRNVSFIYPGTDKKILDDLSFTINNGIRYSFVGVNGAGKTTIIKLLTGLYQNYTGDILVDGRSFRDLTQAEIKGLSSVVYQDFAKYYISLYDNIAVADISSEGNQKEINRAIELAGLTGIIEKLKDGANSILGKIWSDSVDLSGGEWQRVAIARSVLNAAPLKILDEPTAALDPVSESDVYRNFERISQNQSTIYISHRLGSTKLADIIYVLSNGKIIETGSHSELMSRDNGFYAEMFNSQAEWYRNAGEQVID